MRLIPRSLLTRTALVILLALVITQCVSVFLFRYYITQPRTEVAAIGFVSHLKSISAALETIPPERHLEFIGRLHEKEGIRVVRVRDAEPIAPAGDVPVLHGVRTRIKEQFGEKADLFVRPGAATTLWVKLPVGDMEYWVVFPRNRVERDTSWAWAGWAAFGSLVALLGAFFLVHRLNEPLRAVSRAAREIGRGRTPQPVPESGPDEIRDVARAINQMGEDLHRLDRERATFLAGVSHDLRTPLARMRLNVEMLGAQVDPETQSGMTEDIEDMDSVIGQFLDFAREESSETPIESDLDALVNDAVARVRRDGAEVSLDLGKLPPVTLRPVAMQRLIGNLLHNAVRYGGAQVGVRTSAGPGGVVLSITDRGPGIPAGEIERMKQPFTRLDAARGGKSGAGLGLAIVERIARLHGGRFELLPRDGGGLEARLTLPAHAPR